MEDAMHTAIPLTVLATALACSLATAPAHARARVFVASYGNDTNPCTFLSPCKTFQVAINAVDPGGEVTAIDSAGFGPLFIIKAVSITSPPGVEAGIVPASGANAIGINAGSTDKVVLRGLTLDGASSGLNGIAVGNVGVLEIDGCVIRNFTEDGIAYGSGNTATYTLVIHNTISSLNGTGMSITPIGVLKGIIDNVVITNNQLDGLIVSSTPAVTLTVSNSVISNNGAFGMLMEGTGKAMVSNSVVSSNGEDGLTVNGATATLRVTKTTITGNPIGWSANSGGVLESFGDNSLRGNTTDGTPTTTIGLK
jgi:hypothetical protein